MNLAAASPVLTGLAIAGVVAGVIFFGWIAVQIRRLPKPPPHDRWAEDKVDRPIFGGG